MRVLLLIVGEDLLSLFSYLFFVFGIFYLMCLNFLTVLIACFLTSRSLSVANLTIFFAMFAAVSSEMVLLSNRIFSKLFKALFLTKVKLSFIRSLRVFRHFFVVSGVFIAISPNIRAISTLTPLSRVFKSFLTVDRISNNVFFGN
jgi:hypothetical protein